MKLLIIFIVLNILNVVIQTVKNIATIKCGKGVAAITNAVAYGLYTIVTVYMLCELPLFLKASIVALCNLVGVYIVKLIEEKARKDALWKIEATVDKCYQDELCKALNDSRLSYNYIENIGRYTIFNIFCDTQEESAQTKHYLDKYLAKYFVSESKTL